jgi:hypothetical protein
MPEAITLSIYGYHFRKVCELHVQRRDWPQHDQTSAL